MPSKHVRLSESILGVASIQLGYLDSATTVEELWDRITTAQRDGQIPRLPAERFYYGLDLLYMMGAIRLNERGEIEREAS